MSLINTFTNTKDNIVVETRDCGEGVISVKTIYLNEDKRSVEHIILTTGSIIINTFCIKKGTNQEVINPKSVKQKPKQVKKEKDTEQQKFRNILLKRVIAVKKENEISFPKRETYINKTNDELLILIDEIKKTYIEPIDKVLLDILEFKKRHNLRLPLKKKYAKLPIEELKTLLEDLTNKIKQKTD